MSVANIRVVNDTVAANNAQRTPAVRARIVWGIVNVNPGKGGRGGCKPRAQHGFCSNVLVAQGMMGVTR